MNEPQHTEQSLKTWLRQRVAFYVRAPQDSIATDVPLAQYGLDSVYALTLSGDIEDHLGRSLDPTVMWDHQTIDALAAALMDMLQTA